MGVKSIVTACALAMGSGALWAGTGLAGETPAGVVVEAQPKSTVNDPSRRVCRNVMVSGTRLSRRTCRMRADWDGDAERVQREIQNVQVNGQRRDGDFVEQGLVRTPRQ